MKRGTGLRGAPRLVRTPRDPLYSRATRRGRLAAGGGEQDGVLILNEVGPPHDGNPAEICEGLRLLARWIARAAVDQHQCPNRRKTRELSPRNSALLP